MQAIQIKIYGKVQGVWFRKSTQLKAQEIGLQGTVRNLSDGTVWVEAEGTTAQLQNLVDWCHIGSKHAHVERVEVIPSVSKGLEGFVVVR